jgi:hypothetical protein
MFTERSIVIQSAFNHMKSQGNKPIDVEIDSMGRMMDGEWQDRWYDTRKTGGKFVRRASTFRNWVTPDGSPGPTGEGGFKAEAGRYIDSQSVDARAWLDVRRRRGRRTRRRQRRALPV